MNFCENFSHFFVYQKNVKNAHNFHKKITLNTFKAPNNQYLTF